MNSKPAPATVRLTPKGAAALSNLKAKHHGVSSSLLVENALIEAASQSERLTITEEDYTRAVYIQRYLIELALAHKREPKSLDPQASQIALAAHTSATLIKRVFLEAKGRIEISKP